MDGYVDLTPEELLAGVHAVDSAPPPHLMALLERLDDHGREAVRSTGWRSLRARGLASSSPEDGAALDAELAGALRSIGAPGLLVSATAVGAEVGMSWLFVTPEEVVVISVIDDGIQRLRALPVDELAGVLSKVCRLQDLPDAPVTGAPMEVRLPGVVDDSATDLVEALGSLQAPTGETPPDVVAVGELLGEGAVVRSVTASALLDDGSLSNNAVIWVERPSACPLLVSRRADDVVSVAPVDVSALVTSVEHVLLHHGEGADDPNPEPVVAG